MRRCTHCGCILTARAEKCPSCRVRLVVTWKTRKAGHPLTLGGTLFLHNGVERDYCFEQTLACMMEVCDQVALIDASSTDGTLEVLQKWKERHPFRIKLDQLPWEPNAGGFWLCALTNEARQMLTTDMHLLMGGDEVIHPRQYARVRELAQMGRVVQFRRYNFRASAWHITPMARGGGGDWFRRLGPVNVPAEFDGGELEDRADVILGEESGVELYHYGQARTAEGFVKRSRDMLGAYWGGHDPIFDEVEKSGMKMLCESKGGTAVPWGDMVPFTGEHPPSMVPWLRERGYEV